MNQRAIVLAAVLTIALVLGFRLGTPKITQAVANATTTSIEATPAIASVTPPSIDTTPYWNGSDFISSFGMPNSATYGQTISMTGSSATLTQFSFFIEVSSTTVFRGYVFEWDGSKATGAPLFESVPMSTTQGANFEEVVFIIPHGIALTAGQQYVLFASTSKDPAQPDSAGKWGTTNSNAVYSGGQFVYLNNGANPSQWTSTPWSTIAQDLAFRATLVKPSIDTTPYWNGSDFISSFGMTDTATYGQTISVTEPAALTQFSFFMKAQTTTIFRGFVYEWDGTNSRAIGAPLFESAPKSTTQGTNFEEITFHVSSEVALLAGHQYVLFASTSKDPLQPVDAGRWGSVTNTAYTGGQFVFINNYTDTTKWTGAPWSTIASDLAFKVTLVNPASIDTTPYWNRSQYISSFGMPNTATYGQTISMTTSAKLTQFSFFMAVSPTTIFRGFVFRWDGTNSRATGAPLFESVPMSTTQGANFEEVVFIIPHGIALTAGQQYVLFASTSKDPAQPNSAGKWGTTNSNAVYSGGQFVYLNNGANPPLWTSTPWSTIAQDLAFRAAMQYQIFLPMIMRQ